MRATLSEGFVRSGLAVGTHARETGRARRCRRVVPEKRPLIPEKPGLHAIMMPSGRISCRAGRRVG